MKVTLPNGKQVYVRWQYNIVPTFTSNGEKIGETDQTICFLETPGKPKEERVIDSVSVKRYHLDRPDKDLGRKISLNALMDRAYPLKKVKYSGNPSKEELEQLVQNVKSENAPNKAIRRLFWEAYLNRNNK